jgi:Cu+-exporting ATPase
LNRCTAALCLADHCHDAREHSVRADLVGTHDKRSGSIHGAAYQLIAGFFGRQRIAARLPRSRRTSRLSTGKGVTGKIGGRSLALGNAKLMADLGISFGDLELKADALRGDGATALFLAIDGKPGGVIAIADPIKATTQAALESLRNYGIRIVMLTGDNKTTAEAVARKLAIKEVEADVLPQDKNRIVKKLTAEGRIVAMAGDGVNDAPALAEASVGIAMGTGTEVAIQSAGITLVKGDLAGIARAIVLSRATMRNIRENLVFAFAYNAIGIPIAAGVLYPTFGILLSPIVGALAMSMSSVSVILNALRLRTLRLSAMDPN